MADITKNPSLDTISSQEPENKPYQGEIVFHKKTISFRDTVILRQNITKVEKYGVKSVYRISDTMLVFSGIMVLVGFTSIPYTLILSLIFGFVLFTGIKERNRPKLSGITIELSSGTQHYFLSADKKGIDNQFNALAEALENGEPFTLDFSGSTVTMTNITGDRNIIGNNNTSGDTTI